MANAPPTLPQWTTLHHLLWNKITKCLRNMSVESGVLGENAPLVAVVACKLVNTALSTETNVALIVLMVTEIKNNVHATLGHAQLIVKGVGASTVLVLPPVVEESRPASSTLLQRPLTAAKLAHTHTFPRRFMLAAQNHARRIVRATGRSGASAPMAEKVRMALNAVPCHNGHKAHSIESSMSLWKPQVVDADARPSMKPLTPKTANCLVAQNHAKVPGAPGARVLARMSKRLRWMVAMAKLHAVEEAKRQRSSALQRRRSVVAHVAMQLMRRR
jgi:hypothetical protein